MENNIPPAVVAPPQVVKKSFLSRKMIIIVGTLMMLLVVGFFAFRLIFGGLKSSLGETELTWWGLWEADAAVAQIISEYEAANPNIKINYVMQSKEDYRERLTSNLAKGTGPDIFRYHNTWVPMFVNDLSPMPASVMTTAEFTQTFYPVVATDLTYQGQIVGMPLMFDSIALFINESIFETYGKVTPATWNDLRETALSLTVKDENGRLKQAGVALGTTTNVDNWPDILSLMMLQNGVKMTDPVGIQAESALQFYNLFSKIDKVWDETMPPSTIAFSSGKLAMYLGPSWRAHEIRQQNPNLRFKVVPAPQLPKDTPSEPDINLATYWAEGVWKGSKNSDEAWKFLKFLSKKENLEKFYTSAKLLRAFGEPYPRVDMQNILLTDPYVGAFVSQGNTAKSWYMVDRTWDGPTGINSQLISYFEDALNALNQGGGKAAEVLVPAAAGVNQVLSTYGIVARTPVTQ